MKNQPPPGSSWGYDASTMTCNVRDKARGPRYSSQPHLRLSVFNPSITCTIEPHQKPSKEKEPHLKNEPAWTEKKWGQSQRPAVSTQRQRRVKPWNKANCSTLRRRITQLKCVNSEEKMKPHSGQLFNTRRSTGWKPKNGQQFTLHHFT